MAADVADWFFETFTTALARPNARAADYASALWLNERGWRCGGCPAALAAGHVLELSVDEAAEVCASGVAKCEWQLAAAFHFVISLFTTIGYGDLTPSTPFGQVLVLVIALPGITLVALFVGSLAASARHLMLRLNDQRGARGGRDADADGPRKPKSFFYREAAWMLGGALLFSVIANIYMLKLVKA